LHVEGRYAIYRVRDTAVRVAASRAQAGGVQHQE
jgi:hypothetical protein